MKRTRVMLCLSVLLLVTACSERANRPYLMLQVCLNNEAGVLAFKETVSAVSQSEGHEHADLSEWSDDNRRRMVETNPDIDFVRPAVHVRVKSDRHSLVATNLGLSPYEVVIGFNGDEAGRPDFSTPYISALEAEWALHQVPEGQGARPLEKCGQTPLD